MSFPRQVKNTQIKQALENFYRSVDENIVETFKRFKRRPNSNIEGTAEEDLSELDYNRRKFHEVMNKIKSGKDKVTVEYYNAQVLNTTPPRLQTQVNQFQLNFRYGTWFREENVVS